METVTARLRDHLTARAMRNEWASPNELVRFLRVEWGLRLALADVYAALCELTKAKNYRLEKRPRAGTKIEEFRLYAVIGANDAER